MGDEILGRKPENDSVRQMEEPSAKKGPRNTQGGSARYRMGGDPAPPYTTAKYVQTGRTIKAHTGAKQVHLAKMLGVWPSDQTYGNLSNITHNGNIGNDPIK